MTLEQVEAYTGLSSSNIRFYAREGLIPSLNGPYGLRNMASEDVEILQKVKLLRSLGLTVVQLKDMSSGQISLQDALLGLLNSASQDSSFQIKALVCRSLLQNGEEYSTLDPNPYLRQLSADMGAAVPEEDRFLVSGHWRRYLARILDLSIYNLLWLLVLGPLLREDPLSRTFLQDLLDTWVSYLIMLFIEPLFLHFWGTTPGKWLLGLKVDDGCGGKLTYLAGLKRTWGVVLRGMGLGIPIYSLVRLWISRRIVIEGGELDWEVESTLSLNDRRAWRGAAYAGSMLLLSLAMVAVMLFSQMPRHRGRLTPEEFVENFNDLAEYFEADLPYTLLSDGTWRENGKSVQYIPFSPDELPVMEFGLLDGELVSVSFHHETDSSSETLYQINILMQLSAAAYAGAQPEVRVFSDDMANLMDSVVIDEICTSGFYVGDVSVVTRMDSSGYYTSQGMLFREADAEDAHFSLTFSMTKENNG